MCAHRNHLVVQMVRKPASMYREVKGQANTRREYVGGIPNSRLSQFEDRWADWQPESRGASDYLWEGDLKPGGAVRL